MRKFHFITLTLLLITLYTPPASVYADACAHAPRSRLHVGDAAVVAEGIDRLNLRALPAVDTGVERQIYAGATMTILAGPSCNHTYNWWRVEMENGERGWVAEGNWERYYVISARDVGRTIDPLDWSCHFRFF